MAAIRRAAGMAAEGASPNAAIPDLGGYVGGFVTA